MTLGVFALVTMLGVGLVVGDVPARLSLVVVGVGIVLGAVYGVAILRVRSARQGLTQGPHRQVKAIGWCRPPDGCNYAIFEDPAAQDDAQPTWVMRLPLRRQMTTATAWLCGSVYASGACLIATDGTFLGAGRILDRAEGLAKWNRRNEPPSRFVQQPPRDWHPPGG